MTQHTRTIAILFFLGMILCGLYLYQGGVKDIRDLIQKIQRPLLQDSVITEKGIRMDTEKTPVTFCDRVYNITRVYVDGISILDRTNELLQEPVNRSRCNEFNQKFGDSEQLNISSIERGESVHFYSLLLSASSTTQIDFLIFIKTNENIINLTAGHILGSFDKTRVVNITPPAIVVSSSPHDRKMPYRPYEENFNKIVTVCDKKYILWRGLMYKKENIIERVFATIQNTPQNKRWFCGALEHDPRKEEVPPEINVFLEVLAYNPEGVNTQYVMRVSTWARAVGGFNPKHSADIHIDIKKNVVSVYGSPMILGRARNMMDERFIYLILGIISFTAAVAVLKKKHKKSSKETR